MTRARPNVTPDVELPTHPLHYTRQYLKAQEHGVVCMSRHCDLGRGCTCGLSVAMIEVGLSESDPGPGEHRCQPLLEPDAEYYGTVAARSMRESAVYLLERLERENAALRTKLASERGDDACDGCGKPLTTDDAAALVPGDSDDLCAKCNQENI